MRLSVDFAGTEPDFYHKPGKLGFSENLKNSFAINASYTPISITASNSIKKCNNILHPALFQFKHTKLVENHNNILLDNLYFDYVHVFLGQIYR